MNDTILKISYAYSTVLNAYHQIRARGDDWATREYLESQQTNLKIWIAALEELADENKFAKDLLKEICELYSKSCGVFNNYRR